MNIVHTRFLTPYWRVALPPTPIVPIGARPFHPEHPSVFSDESVFPVQPQVAQTDQTARPGSRRVSRNLVRIKRFGVSLAPQSRSKSGMVQAEVTAPGRQDRGWVAILDQ